MTTNASQIVLNTQDSVAPIGIIAMNGAKELGDKINNYLVTWAQDSDIDVDSYLIETTCPRFSSGDAKGLIKESIRGDDIYIIIDTGNYSCTYTAEDSTEEITVSPLTVRSLFRNSLLCRSRTSSASTHMTHVSATLSRSSVSIT